MQETQSGPPSPVILLNSYLGPFCYNFSPIALFFVPYRSSDSTDLNDGYDVQTHKHIFNQICILHLLNLGSYNEIYLILVLIEKLLRATEVKRIYLMVRPKAGKSIEERLTNFCQNVVSGRVHT